MVLPSPATVPARLLSSLVVAAGLGELHKTLEPEVLWHPPGEPDHSRAEVDELLTVQGWRGRGGGLEREVAASLAVLCRPDEEFYGWATHGGATSGLVAGRIGKDGVLAVARPDGMISLASVPSSRLADRLVAQLPDVPPASFTPVVVSIADVRATSPSGRQRGGVLSRRASPEARQARRLSSRPTTGGGELSVAVRDRWGHRTRADQPLRYADTDLGRIANLVVDDDLRVRVEPGSRASLAATLRQMRAAVTARRGGPGPARRG